MNSPRNALMLGLGLLAAGCEVDRSKLGDPLDNHPTCPIQALDDTQVDKLSSCVGKGIARAFNQATIDDGFGPKPIGGAVVDCYDVSQCKDRGTACYTTEKAALASTYSTQFNVVQDDCVAVTKGVACAVVHRIIVGDLEFGDNDVEVCGLTAIDSFAKVLETDCLQRIDQGFTDPSPGLSLPKADNCEPFRAPNKP